MGMSKERLEEIKRQLEESNSYDDNPNGYWYRNINWLIEQAERVQELEKELVYYKMATESYIDVEQQNKRYREAIKEAGNELFLRNAMEEDATITHALEILNKALEGEE